MNEELILPRLSPIRIIGFGSLIGLLLVTFITYHALQQPWLGIQVSQQAGSSKLKIIHVYKNSPATNKLKPGDKITGFQANDQYLEVNPLYNLEEPAILPTYEEHNAFIAAQDTLAKLLSHNTVTIHLENKSVAISPVQQRALSSLPLVNYWLVVLFGFSALIIGLSVWSFRRGETVSRILAVAGSSFFIATIFNATTLSRELALNGEFYYAISSVSHFGVILFALSTVALIWHYPNKISDFPATPFIYLFFLLIWVNQTWQIISLPFHVYYFHFLVDFLFLTAFSIRQWYQSRHSAIDQAALQWVLFSLLLSLGIVVALFYVPTIFSTQPLIPTGAAYFSGLLVFIGLTMGIIKYRLFNLSHILLASWVWIVAGSILLLVDLALVFLLEIASGFAFALSAVIVGWIYFPARQWIATKVLKLQPRSVEQYFPLLIENLIATDEHKTLQDKWPDILQDIFLPIEIKTINEVCDKVNIVNNGINLLVPSLDKKSTLSLAYRDNAKKLYTYNDVKLCNSLYELAVYTANIKQAHEEGAQTERKRIARDLHDDIASQLLTLIHRSNDLIVTEKARDTLAALRETIYSLDSEATVDIRAVLDSLYKIINERTSLAGLVLNWDAERLPKDRNLSPRQHINLQRAIQEIISNIIKHAFARQITVFITINEENLQLQICDDGVGGNVDEWVAGKGLNNISTRIEEINGSVSWHNNANTGDTGSNQGCCINLQFPL